MLLADSSLIKRVPHTLKEQERKNVSRFTADMDFHHSPKNLYLFNFVSLNHPANACDICRVTLFKAYNSVC